MDDKPNCETVKADDTFGAEHGDIRFISTENWNCAIGTCQIIRDCNG
jgi:hypothetical protein